MSNFSQDLNRYLECNKLPKSLFHKIIAILACPGVQFVLSYRIRCWFARRHLGILEIIMLRLEELFFSTSILRYYGVQIGSGLYMPHPFGIVIGGATIGKNFTIAQHCTIGGKKPVGAFGIEPPGWNSKERVSIGDWVFMGAGSCVLGPVTIGDNVIIGANSVVTKDIPSNVLVAGAPAKIIKQLKSHKK
jgi:serine O-acetyltransferase